MPKLLSVKNNNHNNKRIAINTLMLYFRMALVLIVGLFTSRVILNTLGVENYGIYNVVGGFVLIFSFLNGAMATASQRFITFELAHDNIERQIKTFSTAVNIHIFLALIIVIFAETIGLWFFYHELVIPQDRMVAAMWVYQISIATIFISIISVPYNSLIIAHEKMSAFAWISILDVSLKLGILYLLIIATCDKLILYALLLFIIQVIDRIIYGWYCVKNFREASYRPIFDRTMFKGMTNIAGWSLFGNIAGIGYTQGINILLNIFFGPAVNAARGIAVTVQGVVGGFASNIQMAINPQITKSYALQDYHRLHSLIFSSSKYCFFLLYIFILPLLFNTEFILFMWLKTVPEYTVWFVRITLCITLLEALSNPLMIANQAVGKVKIYQSIVGGTLLLIVPIAYLVLKLGGNPTTVFIVQLIVALIATFLRIVIVSRMIDLSLNQYFSKVICRITLVFTISLLTTYGIASLLSGSPSENIFMIGLPPIIVMINSYYLGLSKNEKSFISNKIKYSVCSKLKYIKCK